MSPLRVLGFCYLATASCLALALATADRAQLRAVSDGAGATVTRRLDDNVWRSLHGLTRSFRESVFDPPQRQAILDMAPPEPSAERSYAQTKLPVVAPKRLVDQYGAKAIIAPAPDEIVPVTPSFDTQALTPAEARAAVENAVQARLEQRLSPELRNSFDLFLYVSTAAKGPAAQRLYLFKKDDGGKLALVYDWAASTGREALETSPQGRRVFTATPHGLYQFDPARFYRQYFSRAWNGDMPFAMFLDWERNGAKSGVAVHAATGAGIAHLGKRTSAGCIHLSPKHAELLFKLIRSDYKGRVPRFAYDAASQTGSNQGELMRDGTGGLVMADGYRVLIDIEEFSGNDALAGLF
jgi:lipoprotein-anchoring transpeptidase ErfK/SrfK